MEFYDRLTERCNAQGVTVTALLQRLGLSTSKGTSWKNGSFPKADVISKLATALNTSSSYLLGETDDPDPMNSFLDELDDDTKAILKLCAEREGLAKKLLELAEALAK